MKAADRYADFRARAPGGSIRDEFAGVGRTARRDRTAGALVCRRFRARLRRPRTAAKCASIQFGVWNREAGPDFAEAAISIDGGPPLRGAIELDPEAADWERHGHATNPAYENVILHVSFRQGGGGFLLPHRRQSRSAARAARSGGLPRRGAACAAAGRAGPLRGAIARSRAGDGAQPLEAAAQFRLRRKAERLLRLREAHGADEALYQALAETLGYKSNKLPFALLSQRVPLAALLPQKARAEALLFGVAGFLRSADFLQASPDTRAYLRDLWQDWWALRAEWEPLQIEPEALEDGRAAPGESSAAAARRAGRDSCAIGRKFAPPRSSAIRERFRSC